MCTQQRPRHLAKSKQFRTFKTTTWQGPHLTTLLLAVVACAVAPVAAVATQSTTTTATSTATTTIVAAATTIVAAATTTVAAATTASPAATTKDCAALKNTCCKAACHGCWDLATSISDPQCSRVEDCVGRHSITKDASGDILGLRALDCSGQVVVAANPPPPQQQPPPPRPAALTPQMGGSMTIDDTESTESSSAWQNWCTALVAGGVTITVLGGVTCHCRDNVLVHWNDTAKPVSPHSTPLRLTVPNNGLKTDVIEEMNLL